LKNRVFDARNGGEPAKFAVENGYRRQQSNEENGNLMSSSRPSLPFVQNQAISG
jgi:hypothetical protein